MYIIGVATTPKDNAESSHVASTLDGSSAGRVANPTASTPATFGENLNWDRAENGPTDPTT